MFGVLTFTHRWFGVVLALFMLGWFSSGLLIAFVHSPAATRVEQLAHAASLAPQDGWLSLGEALTRSAPERATRARAQREEPHTGVEGRARERGDRRGESDIVEARLTRVDGAPVWVIEDDLGQRLAISASDGALLEISAAQAERIARAWRDAPESERVAYDDTVEAPVGVRNPEALRPFHRVAIDDGAGSQVVVSQRTGEVVQNSTRVERALAYAGGWLHLFRWLDDLGAGDFRRDALSWAGGLATLGALTGLILGFIRWRPGFFGRPTYLGGRTQPYREFWFKYHFWVGLIGGVFALLWATSGFLSTNPGQIFSPATASREELARFSGGALPPVVKDWKPDSALAVDENVVGLQWSRLADQAILFAVSRDGSRKPLAVAGTVEAFDEAALLAAVQRLAGETAIASHELLSDYDDYYYPNHRQTSADKPLPALRVDLADAAKTSVYVDPKDGRLLARFDDSRRFYRWLYSAAHHWDFGWFHERWLRNAWLATWISFGVVLGLSAVVLGWRRLRRTFIDASARYRPVISAKTRKPAPHTAS